MIRSGICAIAATIALSLPGATAQAADLFTLKSSTFADGKMMPKKVSNNTPGNANCVGENVSPQFSWSGFAEGEVSKPGDKFVGGKSTQGVGFYSGPCTPPNVTPHHYTFVLIATDFDPKELPPGLTRDELTAKFGPPPAHLKGTTGMIGLFVNPWRSE